MSLIGGEGIIYVNDAYLDFQSAGGGIVLEDGTSITSGTTATFGSDILINTGTAHSMNTTGEANLQSITTTSVTIDNTAITPTFASGTLTVDGFQRTYSVHHYEASADITEIAAGSNISDGDQVVMSITNISGSNVQISTGGTNNKSNFTETCLVTGIKLTGNMHFSTSVFI